MNWSGLSLGRQILLVSSVVLLIDSFLHWQAAGPYGVSGWHGFWGVVMGLLTIALLAWLIVAILNLANLSLGIADNMIEALLAWVLTAVVVIKFLTANEFRHWPAWIGLLLGIIIAVGGWLRFSEGTAPARTTTTAPPPPA
jgi:hypothetical protein